VGEFWLSSPLIFLRKKNGTNYKKEDINLMAEEFKSPVEGAKFVPVETYEIRVAIGELDYTSDLISANFKSSLSTGYQTMNLVFELDPTDIILYELYGGQEIKVAIILKRETSEMGPRIDLDLVLITSNFLLNEKQTESSTKQKDRGILSVRTVVRPAYQIINSLVNAVFIGKDLNSIITSLATSVGAKKLVFDSDGRNNSPIDQVCIPPTTFYKIIKEYDRNNPEVFDGFLDQRFGLFNGVPGVFCQFDKTVYIKNLTSKMNKSPVFTIYQMASDTEVKRMEEIIKKSTDGKTFYTYDTIHTDYSANAKFASLGSNINHVIKPKDTLSAIFNQNLETVAGTYGLIYQNKKIFKNSAIDRKKYYNEDTGNETEQTIFNSRFARQVADLSTISINLERNLPVLDLIQVGECVDFKPLIVDYLNLSGKYILWSVDIMFTRPSTWETVASVNLIRTNKISGQEVKPYKNTETLAIALFNEIKNGKTLNESLAPNITPAKKDINWGHVERLTNQINKLQENINKTCGGAIETLSLSVRTTCRLWRNELDAAKVARATEMGTTQSDAEAIREERKRTKIVIPTDIVTVSENKQANVKPFQEKSKEEIAEAAKDQQRIEYLENKLFPCELNPTQRGCGRSITGLQKELDQLLAKQKSR
jgi:hypothetical protein